MNTPAQPELEQLVDTFRAVTEDDVTEPLLPTMRSLIGELDRRCSGAYGQPETPQPGAPRPERRMWTAS